MAYTPIPTTLEKLKNLPSPIRVAEVGAVEFGRDVITQIRRTWGADGGTGNPSPTVQKIYRVGHNDLVLR